MTMKINLPKHKTRPSSQFVLFQWKPHFIHDLWANDAAFKNWNCL